MHNQPNSNASPKQEQPSNLVSFRLASDSSHIPQAARLHNARAHIPCSTMPLSESMRGTDRAQPQVHTACGMAPAAVRPGRVLEHSFRSGRWVPNARQLHTTIAHNPNRPDAHCIARHAARMRVGSGSVDQLPSSLQWARPTASRSMCCHPMAEGSLFSTADATSDAECESSPADESVASHGRPPPFHPMKTHLPLR